MTDTHLIIKETATSEIFQEDGLETILGGSSQVLHEVIASGPVGSTGVTGSVASLSPDAGNRATARPNGIYVEIEYETSQW